MSNISTSLSLIIQVQNGILYTNYIMFLAGFIGNILNILIFTNLKVFQGNRCTFYLIIESIANNFILSTYFIPQIFQIIYGNDPGNLSIIWCKIRTTLGQSCRFLISSIICFEAFDQYLSTHHQFYFRQISTLRLARSLILIFYSISILQSIPYIIFSEIVSKSGCLIINIYLVHYYTYCYYIFLNGLLPILISSFFSLLAYRNVRHLVRLQIPVGRRRLDRQMTAMIFIRVIVFVIFLTPYTIFRIMTTIINTSSFYFSNGINQLLSTIVGSLLMWIFSLNFYIFLAISSRFRQQVKRFFIRKCWQSIKQSCKSNHNVIHPLPVTTTASDMELE